MSKIEEIQQYINETNVSTENQEQYCMYASEIQALYKEMHRDPYNAMCLIFNYGRAKGYRAGNAAKRGQVY